MPSVAASGVTARQEKQNQKTALARGLLLCGCRKRRRDGKSAMQDKRDNIAQVAGPWDTCLIGSLDVWPLPDLLLWLHQTQRTAMVRVGTGLSAGVIFFNRGHMFRCEWGKLQGEQALMGLLVLREGSFSLIQRGIPEARPNIVRPTAEVLFQCAVAIDGQARQSTRPRMRQQTAN
jgi:hypothetical protein